MFSALLHRLEKHFGMVFAGCVYWLLRFVWIVLKQTFTLHKIRFSFCMFYKLVSEWAGAFTCKCLALFQFVCWNHKKFNMHLHSLKNLMHGIATVLVTLRYVLCNAFGLSHIIMVLLTLKCVEPQQLLLKVAQWTWFTTIPCWLCARFFCFALLFIVSFNYVCSLALQIRLMISFESPSFLRFYGIFGRLTLNLDSLKINGTKKKEKMKPIETFNWRHENIEWKRWAFNTRNEY